MATMAEIPPYKRVDDLRSETRQGFAKTDQRLDDLRSEMHRGFGQVDTRFDRVEADVRELRTDHKTLRADMNNGFESVQATLADMHKLMIRFFAGTLGSIIAGVVLLFVTHH
jgi:hypothetical protein